MAKVVFWRRSLGQPPSFFHRGPSPPPKVHPPDESSPCLSSGIRLALSQLLRTCCLFSFRRCRPPPFKLTSHGIPESRLLPPSPPFLLRGFFLHHNVETLDDSRNAPVPSPALTFSPPQPPPPPPPRQEDPQPVFFIIVEKAPLSLWPIRLVISSWLVTSVFAAFSFFFEVGLSFFPLSKRERLRGWKRDNFGSSPQFFRDSLPASSR